MSIQEELVRTSVPEVHIHISVRAFETFEITSKLHIHNEIELIGVKSGSIIFSDGINETPLYAGDVAFINYRIPHATIGNGAYEDTLIQFSPDDFVFSEHTSGLKYISRFLSALGERTRIFRKGEDGTEELFRYIYHCGNEYNMKQPAYSSYVKSDIYGILGFLYRHNIILDAEAHFEHKTAEALAPVLSFIEKNYASSITLDELSAVARLNKYYFCRMFKKATNSTVTDFINWVRIYKAQRLLTGTRKSISEISYETGFYSISYFNRTFRKITKLTPSEYRKVKYSPNK